MVGIVIGEFMFPRFGLVTTVFAQGVRSENYIYSGLLYKLYGDTGGGISVVRTNHLHFVLRTSLKCLNVLLEVSNVS